MPTFDRDLLTALRHARSIVVLTGAGVSAESGIPTFRDALTGLWARFDAQRLATPEAFATDPALVWGWYEWRRGAVLRCQPNRAHAAIARLQRRVPDVHLLTQNVDDLHERAGSRAVIHLHGSLHRPRCSQCGQTAAFPPGAPNEPVGGRRLQPPRCVTCQGLLRPGVVWFGESLPQGAWSQAQERARTCDMLFSVGTSSMVYPVAGLPRLAHNAGARIIQINPHPTGIEDIVDHDLRAPAGTVLPALVQAAWPGRSCYDGAGAGSPDTAIGCARSSDGSA